MRSFIYCRVSTREQSSEDHYSLDNQEQRCQDYSKMKKWRVSKIRKDVASGKNDERAGFQELLTHVTRQAIFVSHEAAKSAKKKYYIDRQDKQDF